MRSTASVLLALGLAAMAIAGATATTVLQPPTEIGNAACRSCHRQIYDAYARTQMARTSGPALAGLVEGNFTHAPSGIRYRVFAEGDRAALSFERPGDAAVRGRVPLKYFVGSNTRGRTFLFEIDRFLYQSPINYYARRHVAGLHGSHGDAAESRGGSDLPLVPCEPTGGGRGRHDEPVRRRGLSSERRRMRALPWARTKTRRDASRYRQSREARACPPR